jgi:hypothetical protein
MDPFCQRSPGMSSDEGVKKNQINGGLVSCPGTHTFLPPAGLFGSLLDAGHCMVIFRLMGTGERG